MKKLLLILILTMLASSVNIAQITNDTYLVRQKGGTQLDSIKITDIDSITFPKLGGVPTCTIEVDPPVLNTLTFSGVAEFYVTVIYSKPMDTQNTKPQIKFSTASTSLEFDAKNSLWIEDSIYFAVYKVVDKDQQYVKPNITVTGARDKNANLQNPCALNEAFVLDTRDPEVARIDYPSSNSICDDATGDKYILKFVFNEKMKESVKPTVTIAPSAPKQVLTNEIGEWTTPQEYKVTYTIADAEINSSATFSITNALDLAGNKIEKTEGAKYVKIDNQNPRVSSIGASKTNLNLNDVGSTIKITVSFNEAMEEPPDITFSPNIIGKALKFLGSNPTGFANRYEFKYEVIQAVTENFLDVDVIIKDAKDSCGNLSIEYKKLDYFNILFKITKVIEEGFDTYTVGGPPTNPPWERLLPEGLSSTVQTLWRQSEPASLELVPKLTPPPVVVEKALQQFSATPDEINFEIYVLADAVTDSGGIALVTKSSLTPFALLTYGTDGNIYIQSGSGALTKVNFNVGENPYAATNWGLFRLQYNKVSGDLKLYVNNSFITSLTGTVPSGTFDSILMYSAKGKMYFDTILLWHQ